MSDQIQIAVVDDHPLLREGVIHTLKSEKDFSVVADGASADDAIAIANKHKPDILLLDVSMPGGGLAAARAISSSCAGVRTVMLTVSEDENDVRAAMAAGVKGYVLKGIGGSELVNMVRTIMRGETYVTPALAARLFWNMQQRLGDEKRLKEHVWDLTVREEQILTKAALGMSNKEIANRLDLSEKTVKHYMTSVLQKLNARNRVEAILAFQKQHKVNC